jgi:hypothetical protein
MTVLLKHLANHKWFRGIPDEAHGRRDFEERYRWLIEEMFCDFACKDRHLCTAAPTAQSKPVTMATPASRHRNP